MEDLRTRGTVVISKPPARVPKTVHPVLYHRAGKYFTDRACTREVTRGILRAKKPLYSSRQHIVIGGRQRTAEVILGASGDYPDRIAIGDGGLVAGGDEPKIVTDTQEALENEIARELVTQRIVNTTGLISGTFVTVFKTAGSYLTVVPAHGRDYSSKAAVMKDWADNMDFLVMDMSSPWDGKPINKQIDKQCV